MWLKVPEGAWIAVQVHTNTEKKVAVGLRQREYELFLPMYTAHGRWSARSVPRDLPLFPGYLFCRWAKLNRYRIVEIPGVIRIVGAGQTPIPVDDAEIAAVRRIVDSGFLSAPWKFLRAGDRVRVIGGPLCGLEGILDTCGECKVVVNLTLLCRAVAVTIHPSLVSFEKPMSKLDVLLSRYKCDEPQDSLND